MVESQPSKLLVAGSIPVSRSIVFEDQEVADGTGERGVSAGKREHSVRAKR